MVRKLPIALFLALFVSNTQAALVDNGSYIIDTDSGLEWLKLTETFNRTYDDVSSELGIAGEFEGWSYATGAQFEQLLFNQGAVATNCTNGTNFCGWSTENNGLVSSLINLLGDTGEQYFYGAQTDELAIWTVGILADEQSQNSYWEAELYDDPSHFNSAIMDNIGTHDTFAASNYSPYYGGSFLVRTTEIPTPSALFLLSAALFVYLALRPEKLLARSGNPSLSRTDNKTAARFRRRCGEC